MAYFQNGYPGYQPYPYQDQLNQLRNAPIYPARPDPSGLNWVQGEAGAKSWIVPPGGTALLMDSESMRFYIKSTDMNGVPGMRVFEYTEITNQPKPADIPADKFVTREEFMNFVNSLNQRTEVADA